MAGGRITARGFMVVTFSLVMLLLLLVLALSMSTDSRLVWVVGGQGDGDAAAVVWPGMMLPVCSPDRWEVGATPRATAIWRQVRIFC